MNQSAPERESGEIAGRDLTNIAKYWLWAVLLFVCWQPFELGFYMDDWAVQAASAKHGAAFSKQRFSEILAVDATRPGIAIPRFVLSSILGDRPLLWQLAMLLANGLIAACIARVARVISPSPLSRKAILVTLLWVLLPWGASSQFCSVLLPARILLALFAVLIANVISPYPLPPSQKRPQFNRLLTFGYV